MTEPALNGTAYLFAAFYHIDGQFSHLRKFVHYFHNYLDKTPFDCKSVVNTIGKIRDDLRLTGEVRSDVDAFKYLASEEFEKVSLVLPQVG